MRILHLLASPYWSGPAELVALLAQEQRKLGHTVSVAIDRKRAEMDAPSEELAAPRFAALELLDAQRDLELSVKSTPAAAWRDRAALKAREVDVIHCHFSHDHWLATLGRPKGAVVIRSIHAPRSLRWSTPSADGFTVPSHGDLRRLNARKPARVLRPLIEAGFVPPRDKEALRQELKLSGAPLIGMVSTFQPSRRHALAVEAFEQLRRRQRDARLVFVGDGKLVPQIKALVDVKGLYGPIEFLGYQSGADFIRHLQALDEIWVLGLGNDWSGRVAAQARACGVRVIAAAIGGLVETADVVLHHPDALAIARASASNARVERPLPSNAEITGEVLELYVEARR